MKQLSNTPSNQARDKLIQIFRYVQAFHQLQNPVKRNIQEQPWVLWLHVFPDHPCIRWGTILATESAVALRRSDTATARQSGKVTEADGNDFILKVRRPKLVDPPEPPKDIAPLLQNGWQDVNGNVALDPKKAVSAYEDPRRRSLLEQWTAERNQWAMAELPARKR